ncbi:hypothetical protein LWI28_001331 [Acer negundo]|uniref:pectinesterase n=1 Tax=Acer negundo TaxID=4023 RepID=A0AAD5NVG0_ACENE|nr:hypothetical protein LWI28_001331 [Acer negundo]
MQRTGNNLNKRVMDGKLPISPWEKTKGEYEYVDGKLPISPWEKIKGKFMVKLLPFDYEQQLYVRLQNCRQGNMNVEEYIPLNSRNLLLDNKNMQIARFQGAAVAQVRVACKATRYPDTCQNSLSKRVPENPTPTQVLDAAISVSAENLMTAKKMVISIRDSSSGNKNRTSAAKFCLQVLDNSEYRTQSAADALPHGKIKDARAWFSAALAYQYDCWSSLKYVNDTKLVVDTMTFWIHL